MVNLEKYFQNIKFNLLVENVTLWHIKDMFLNDFLCSNALISMLHTIDLSISLANKIITFQIMSIF